MANTLKLEIVTPEGVAYSEDVEMVTIPGTEGELGVYPQHVPLMTQIVPGALIVRKGTQDSLLAVGEGFAEITGDHVSILTDMAIKAESIDQASAEAARQRAEARLRENLSTEDAAMVQAALAQSLAQLKVKSRRK
ncbi:MAG: F0F1 ATP synthase subunit epsilon [Verrucomicrobia bacterium]|nr:F0F1 ATP synthase subunit epsilon [Verrucomicrobiota bacterium]